MILFKRGPKHKVKSYIYCVIQFLREKRHEKWDQESKQKQSLLFNFFNIFDLETSSTELLFLNLTFTDFSIRSNSRKVKEIPWTIFYGIIPP